jgi:hypothetical protein
MDMKDLSSKTGSVWPKRLCVVRKSLCDLEGSVGKKGSVWREKLCEAWKAL